MSWNTKFINSNIEEVKANDPFVLQVGSDRLKSAQNTEDADQQVEDDDDSEYETDEEEKT